MRFIAGVVVVVAALIGLMFGVQHLMSGPPPAADDPLPPNATFTVGPVTKTVDATFQPIVPGAPPVQLPGRAVVKWSPAAPVPYLLLGTLEASDLEFLRRYLADLAALTGLRFVDVAGAPAEVFRDGVSAIAPRGVGDRLRRFAFPSPEWEMTARTIRDLKTAYLVRMTDGPLVVWWEAQLLIVAADASSIAATARHRASVPVETLARFESGRRRCFVSWEVDPARFTLQRAAVFTSTSSSGSHRRCLGHHLLVAMGGGIASMEEDALEIPVFFGPYDDLVGRPACASRAVLRWLYDARTPVGPRWSHGGEDDSELQEALLGEECAGQLGGRLPLR